MTKHSIKLCAHATCVTKHRYQCLSPVGVNCVSDRANIDFIEYMHYKSVHFYNSFE